MPYLVANTLYRRDIRKSALVWRIVRRVQNQLYFPIVEFMEREMYTIAEAIGAPYDFIVCEDRELKGKEADTDLFSGVIRIAQTVYIGACNGDGRARMTIAHELGHYLLHRDIPIKLARSLSEHKPPPYMDTEWQASCFGGELLMPAHLIKGMTPEEVSAKCCVTLAAANYQLSKV